MHRLWDKVAEQEGKSRTIFRQEALKPDEVVPEWEAVREAIGTDEDVSHFMRTALSAHGAIVLEAEGKPDKFNLGEVSPEVGEIFLSVGNAFKATYGNPTKGAIWLTRSHPLVDGLASFVLNAASDEAVESAARRCGVIPSTTVQSRTVLLLLRFRYELVTRRGQAEHRQIAEECHTVGFRGTVADPEWLDRDSVESVINSSSAGNISPDLARHDLEQILAPEKIDVLRPALDKLAATKAEDLLAAHRRVRKASDATGRYTVTPVLPVDIIGLYIYQPQR